MMKIVTGLAVLSLLLTISASEPIGHSRRNNKYAVSRPQVGSEFQSAKSKVSLSCDTGKMVLKINFVQPFGGVIQMGPKRSRECTIRGDNSRTSYVMSVSPDACGSCREHRCQNGQFVNTLYIRYHRTLEREGDDVKTVICKYQAGSIQAG